MGGVGEREGGGLALASEYGGGHQIYLLHKQKNLVDVKMLRIELTMLPLSPRKI